MFAPYSSVCSRFTGVYGIYIFLAAGLLLLGGGLMLMGQRAGRGLRVEAVPVSGRQALGASKG
ncbi:hypothetical protein CJU76_13435 [Pseudomonas fragi]|nr:hypothetical protein CJU76_13435 [Pseudomonas fragi]